MTANCSACGYAPEADERNPQLERRRALVDRVRGRERPGAVEPFEGLAEAQDDHHRVVGDAIQALKLASNDVRGDDELIAAFQSFDTHLARVSLLLPRPDRNASRKLVRAAQQAGEGLECWLLAFTSSTGLEAGRHGARANDLTGAAQELASSKDPAGADADLAAATDSLIEVDKHLLSAHPEWGLGDDPGAGIYAGLLASAARTIFDEERVIGLVHTVQELVDADQLAELMQTDMWRQGELQSNDVIATASRNLQLRLNDEEGDARDVPDGALKMLGDIREAVARHHLATLLHCAGVRDYEKTHRDKSGATLNKAEKWFPSIQLGTLDPTLRNAGAHASVSVKDDRVIIDEHLEPIVFTEEAFLDAVLMDIETLWAVSVGISLALYRAAQGDDALHELMSSSQQRLIITSLLEQAGCGDTRVTVKGCRAEARVSVIPQSPTSLGAAVVPLLPTEVTTFSLLAEGECDRYEAPLAQLRAFHDARPEDQALATLLVLAAERRNGHPTVSYEALKSLIFHELAESEGEAPRPRVERLRRLRSVLECSGHSELKADLQAAISVARRSVAQSPEVPVSFRRG